MNPLKTELLVRMIYFFMCCQLVSKTEGKLQQRGQTRPSSLAEVTGTWIGFVCLGLITKISNLLG